MERKPDLSQNHKSALELETVDSRRITIKYWAKLAKTTCGILVLFLCTTIHTTVAAATTTADVSSCVVGTSTTTMYQQSPTQAQQFVAMNNDYP